MTDDNILRQAAIEAVKALEPKGLKPKGVGLVANITIAKAVEALSALPAVEGWLPIESAPVEQRLPLELYGPRPGDPTKRIVCGWRYGRQWAIYGCGKSQDCVDIIEPTHWRYQRPAPPIE